MPPLVPVTVRGLALDANESPVVLLQCTEPKKVLPIWIGVFEATAIQIALDGTELDRPLTHDLFASTLGRLEAAIEKVVIVALREGTYFAEVHLRRGEELLAIDARPSDALALAVRCRCQILVDQDVLDQGHLIADPDETADELQKRLEDIDPSDLGKYTM